MDIGNLGTQNNPIILNKKITQRALLSKHMPTSETPDFSKFSKKTEYSNHVFNIIAAKELNADEMKLALFLYEQYCFDKLSEIVLITFDLDIDKKEEKSLPKHIYAKSPALKEINKYQIPRTSISEMLRKENIILDTPKETYKYLKKLHDLGLLTLTVVPYRDEVSNETATLEGMRYAFIELNVGVMNAKINRRWGLEKRQLEPKKKSSVNKQSIAIQAKALLKQQKKQLS